MNRLQVYRAEVKVSEHTVEGIHVAALNLTAATQLVGALLEEHGWKEILGITTEVTTFPIQLWLVQDVTNLQATANHLAALCKRIRDEGLTEKNQADLEKLFEIPEQPKQPEQSEEEEAEETVDV